MRHEQHRETYETLKQQQTWLRQIERILDPVSIQPPFLPGPERAAEAAWELNSFVLKLDRQAQTDPRHRSFVDHVAKWVKNLGKGLYACFSEPRLPRTNNDMERFLRRLKGQHRRITGRRSWNQYVMRHGAQVAFHDPTDAPADVLRRLRLVPFSEFCLKRSHWWASQEPARQRTRYRRDRAGYLKNLEETWCS